MAAQGTGIGFRSVQLFKAQSLGIGSYGAVCKAKCDDLLCAAKLLHPILFDAAARAQSSRGREHRLPISRFEQECQFLSSIRHPNIVQYLGTHRDPENGLPVLLMELMDESLTSFIEHSQLTIPYYIQVIISHDIALALSFLHSNGIIHRDLSSNNVLMIGNSRAKVTDFGMAKLAGANPQATRVSLTQTPGADVYMPPEATKIPPIYSEKIDCFSHGVLVVQILTQLFPKPGNRFSMIQIQDRRFPDGIEARVPEIDRRKEHIDLINKAHPLLQVALNCLKDKEGERPTAQEICGRLAAVKQSPQFARSVQVTLQRSAGAERGIKELQLEIQQLHQEIEVKIRSLAEDQQTIASKDAIIDKKATIIASKDRELASNATTIVRNQDELQQRRTDIQTMALEKKSILKTHQAEMQRMRKQIEENERVIEEFQFQQALTKDEKRVRFHLQLEFQLEAFSGGSEGLVSMKLKWREGRKAQRVISRGPDAVVHDTVVYLRPPDSRRVHGYKSTMDEWFLLPDCPYEDFTLAIVDNLLTAIGGYRAGQYSNTLLSLIDNRGDKKWVEKFPPMPTKRCQTCAVSSEATLIVIGGEGIGKKKLNTIEVMSIWTKLWSTAISFPEVLSQICDSAVICDGHIYVVGATDRSHNDTKSVFTCALSALLRSHHAKILPGVLSTSIWSRAADLPVENSTCVNFNGQLVAIGGYDSHHMHPTTAVHMYDATTNSWSCISHMTTPRDYCFVAVLPGNQLMVIGGYNNSGDETDSVEIGTLL